MAKAHLPPAVYIDTDVDLTALIDSLAYESLVAIDTESNSLHAYQERVCLIQLSSRSRDAIIDPLRIADMRPLGNLLSNPQIEKVFHAAEYDLMCLKRDFGFQIVNLFDTMIAARICGYKQMGLNHLLALHFEVQIDKSHQKDNWGDRPLSTESLRYAQMDTHYLPLLRDRLREELIQRKHLAEAEENFRELCIVTPAHDGRSFDPDGYWKIGNPQHLNMTEMGILRELYLLRENSAMRQDTPPFKVMSNQTLIELAREQPGTIDDLTGIIGMTPLQIRRYGKEIILAVRRGRGVKLPPPPHFKPPSAEVADRYTVLHTWRKNKAATRGVESDVIISKQALWDIAEKVPTTLEALQQIDGLGPWRLEAYGHELLQLLNDYENSINLTELPNGIENISHDLQNGHE